MSNVFSVKKLIDSDCQRYWGRKGLKERIRTYLVQASFRYTVEYRKVHQYITLNKKGMGYLYHRYKLLRYSYKYGYQINPEAKIGPGFYMGHRGSVIINGEVTIGKNVNIATGVTIGQENRGERRGVPTIGNNVWIGTNVVIVGDIVIGNNVMLAPNTFVNIDIPDNSIVVGNPAKIIHAAHATEGYIQYPYID